MTATEIRANIQRKLDKIDDLSVLEEVESIINFISSGKEDFNLLPEEVRNSITEGLEQLDKGNKLSYEEVKKRNAKWFST
jgi:hypothetical protein